MPTSGLCKNTPRLYTAVALATLFGLLLALLIGFSVLWKLESFSDVRCWSFADRLLVVRTAASGAHFDFDLVPTLDYPLTIELYGPVTAKAAAPLVATLCEPCGGSSTAKRIPCSKQFRHHPERFYLLARWANESALSTVGSLCQL